MFKKKNNGFTLIELLAVMSIIAVLSSIILVSVNSVRKRGRDARRISDLTQIKLALHAYFDKNGNFIETDSNCGWDNNNDGDGDGNGWFNFSNGGSYPNSIVQCLINEGFLDTEIIDPTGGRQTTPTASYAYMKYHCPVGGKLKVYLFAVLEGKNRGSALGGETDGTCKVDADSLYGMNYYVEVE